MSYPPEHKKQTRARILDAAAVIAREKGLEATGVAEVMNRAGLTVGGFYSHFNSKEELLAHAILRAFEIQDERFYQKLESLEGDTWVDAMIQAYLNPWHRDNPGYGCPLAALASDYPRAGKKVRKAIDGAYERWLEMLGKRLGSKEEAIALTAYLVGALALSRTVKDETLSEQILSSCRKLAKRILTA